MFIPFLFDVFTFLHKPVTQTEPLEKMDLYAYDRT